jgi:hypothetical protein
VIVAEYRPPRPRAHHEATSAEVVYEIDSA